MCFIDPRWQLQVDPDDPQFLGQILAAYGERYFTYIYVIKRKKTFTYKPKRPRPRLLYLSCAMVLLGCIAAEICIRALL